MSVMPEQFFSYFYVLNALSVILSDHKQFLIYIKPGGHVTYNVDLPVRSLLPRGIEGIIVTGLGAGAHRDAMPVIISRAKQLTIDHYFSHFRSVSVALESIGNTKAAPVLFDILSMPGITGHHVISKTDAVRATVQDTNDVTLRNNVLRELHLARALYRCGDHYGLGKQILKNYSNDLHGHYFRHAAGVMDLGFMM